MSGCIVPDTNYCNDAFRSVPKRDVSSNCLSIVGQKLPLGTISALLEKSLRPKEKKRKTSTTTTAKSWPWGLSHIPSRSQNREETVSNLVFRHRPERFVGVAGRWWVGVPSCGPHQVRPTVSYGSIFANWVKLATPSRTSPLEPPAAAAAAAAGRLGQTRQAAVMDGSFGSIVPALHHLDCSSQQLLLSRSFNSFFFQ